MTGRVGQGCRGASASALAQCHGHCPLSNPCPRHTRVHKCGRFPCSVCPATCLRHHPQNSGRNVAWGDCLPTLTHGVTKIASTALEGICTRRCPIDFAHHGPHPPEGTGRCLASRFSTGLTMWKQCQLATEKNRITATSWGD